MKWINPQLLDKNLKATVHKSGKLGFTIEAAQKLQLLKGRAIRIALIEENKPEGDLFVIVENIHNPAETFEVKKAGDYYYTNLKHFYDTYKIDYENSDIIYDISAERIENCDGFLFKKRFKNSDSLLI